MARPKVSLSSAGVRALLNDPGVGEHLLELAEQVAGRARASAPVESGAYADGLVAYRAVTDRTVARAGSTAPHAAVVEASTGNLVRALGGS